MDFNKKRTPCVVVTYTKKEKGERYINIFGTINQSIARSLKGNQRIFNVRAILMWKMHDYPRHGYVRKYSVQGYHACPLCGPKL